MAKNIKVVLELDDKGFTSGIKSASGAVENLDSKTSKSSIGLGTLAAGLAAVSGAALGLASAVGAAQSVEDLSITLETLYGDADLAAQALNTVKEQAAELPVALDAIQRGVPSLALVEDKFGSLGDAIQFTAGVSSAFGMSFDEAAVQVQRALTSGINSAEMFKDRGVAAFLGFEQGATYTAEETRQAFIDNFDRITAANEKAASTMTGQFSMIGDAVFQVQEAVGTAFSAELKNVIGSFLETFNEHKQTILDVATAIGENLGTALKFLVDNMNIIVPIIAAFAAGWAAIKFVAIAQGIMGIRTAVLAMNTAILANPIGAIAAAIAAAAVLIIANWDEIKVAATNAAINIEKGWIGLQLYLIEKFGGAIDAIRTKFADLGDFAIATGVALKEMATSPIDNFGRFNELIAETQEQLRAAREPIDTFGERTGELRERLEELNTEQAAMVDATAAAEAAAQAAADVIDDQAAATDGLTVASQSAADAIEEVADTSSDAADELEAVADAYGDFLKDLERDIYLSGLSSEERDRQITLAEAFEAKAKELGVTLEQLSEETKQGIEEQVDALMDLKYAKEDEVESAIDGEEEKQKALDRTLERIEDNMSALTAASENAVNRMREEHDYMQETIDLYGEERAVAEALYNFNREVSRQETQLEQDIQKLRADGHTAEADALDAELAAIKTANETRRAEIAETARQTFEFQNSFETGWRQAYANWMEDAANAAELGEKVFTTFADGMTDAIVDFANTGKFSFKGLVDDMKQVIIRFMAEKAVKSFLNFLTGGGGGSGGLFSSVVSGISKIFGFEKGGYIPGNRISMVGENGPELFMPATSGTIIPNFAADNFGGGTTMVTYNITATDVDSFKRLVSSDPEFIYNVTLAGSRRVPR